MTFGYQCDEATSFTIMDAAAEAGVTFFDLADVYPLGGGLDTVDHFSHGDRDIPLGEGSDGPGHRDLRGGGERQTDEVAGQLHQVTLGSQTIIEGDVNGDGVADFQIALNGKLTLASSDFLL